MHEDSPNTHPQMLSLAGFDPLGGAGVTADRWAAADLGVHAHAIPTCLVVQNTQGVFGTSAIEQKGFDDSLRVLRDDISFDAVKVGAVATPATARSIVDFLSAIDDATPVVVDPILTGGSKRRTEIVGALGPEFITLYGHASLITPNTEELEKIGLSLGVERTREDSRWMQAIADSLGTALLVTGGHSEEPGLDLLYRPGARDRTEFAARVQLPGVDIHGTGCHFSTAIAALTSRGVAWEEAITVSKRYMEYLIQHCVWSPGSGRPQFFHGDESRAFGRSLVEDED
jgi:hydroxymethylpyrimidine kinase/phosphomethylpyrimidine kinase